MRADNTRFLLQAARNRHETTMSRAGETLRRLDRTGAPVSFRAVAEAAGVSRAWLYRQPELRAEINRLRAAHASAGTTTPPAAQRATDESRQRRIEALLEDNTRLRAENSRLREQAARLLGERRDRSLHTSP